jgi:hypothetical protein
VSVLIAVKKASIHGKISVISVLWIFMKVITMDKIKLTLGPLEDSRDKKNWGNGPWQNEPDREEFEYRNYRCSIKRHPLGHLCGYVTIGAEEVKLLDEDDREDFQVHGGITYNKENKEDGTVTIGFDCAHSSDILPSINSCNRNLDIICYHFPDLYYLLKIKEAFLLEFKPTYKNIEFVRNELHKLVDQIIEETCKDNNSLLS